MLVRTDSVSTRVFGSKIDFTILDVGAFTANGYDPSYYCVWSCTDAESLERVLAAPRPRVRIISIHSLKTVLPLRITQPLVARVEREYDIDHEFGDILYSFGETPHYAEGGATNAFAKESGTGNKSCGYILQYVEENQRNRLVKDANEPQPRTWSHRHSGVFQKSYLPMQSTGTLDQPFDLFILVHPVKNSVFEKRVLEICTKTSPSFGPHKLCLDPGLIHSLILDSYLPNWRPYLRHYGENFAENNDDLLTIDTGDASSKQLEFKFVQRLSSNAFKGNAVILEEKIRGYILGLDTLQERMDNSIDLLQYALDFKNVKTDTEMSRHIVELTHSTVDDSATVKILAILGGLYLPGTFISGLFGMNFFDYDSASQKLVTGSNFWLYCSIWIPLTVATILVYVYLLWRRKLAERARRREDAAQAAAQAVVRDPDASKPVSQGAINIAMKTLSFDVLGRRRRHKRGRGHGIDVEKTA